MTYSVTQFVENDISANRYIEFLLLEADTRIPKILEVLHNFLDKAKRDQEARERLSTSAEIQRYQFEINPNEWSILSSNLLRLVRSLAKEGKIPVSWFNKKAKRIGDGASILSSRYVEEIESWIDLFSKIKKKVEKDRR